MVNGRGIVGRTRRSESRFHSDFAARRGWGGYGVSEAVEGFVTSLAGRCGCCCGRSANR